MMLFLVDALGMLFVAFAGILYWRRSAAVAFKWFGIGAGLWVVAVILKIAFALLVHPAAFGYLKAELSRPVFIAAGGLFLGIESSVFEIGVTWLSVRKWRALGRDAGRAIAIGIGAGSIEALLLGLALLGGTLASFADMEESEEIKRGLLETAATTPAYWLIGPTERAIALLGHTSTRVLVLLGVTKHKGALVAAGFWMFAAIDGVAGAFILSGKGSYSLWWIELGVLPFALVSVPILIGCYRKWKEAD
jgi:uncharacterized membrane protein YhfC